MNTFEVQQSTTACCRVNRSLIWFLRFLGLIRFIDFSGGIWFVSILNFKGSRAIHTAIIALHIMAGFVFNFTLALIGRGRRILGFRWS